MASWIKPPFGGLGGQSHNKPPHLRVSAALLFYSLPEFSLPPLLLVPPSQVFNALTYLRYTEETNNRSRGVLCGICWAGNIKLDQAPLRGVGGGQSRKPLCVSAALWLFSFDCQQTGHRYTLLIPSPLIKGRESFTDMIC